LDFQVPRPTNGIIMPLLKRMAVFIVAKKKLRYN
jgi:hypothetical protein